MRQRNTLVWSYRSTPFNMKLSNSFMVSARDICNISIFRNFINNSFYKEVIIFHPMPTCYSLDFYAYPQLLRILKTPCVPYRTKFRQTKFSSDKIFDTKPKFRQLCPIFAWLLYWNIGQIFDGQHCCWTKFSTPSLNFDNFVWRIVR